jgi:hypothetical protein
LHICSRAFIVVAETFTYPMTILEVVWAAEVLLARPEKAFPNASSIYRVLCVAGTVITALRPCTFVNEGRPGAAYATKCLLSRSRASFVSMGRVCERDFAFMTLTMTRSRSTPLAGFRKCIGWAPYILVLIVPTSVSKLSIWRSRKSRGRICVITAIISTVLDVSRSSSYLRQSLILQA